MRFRFFEALVALAFLAVFFSGMRMLDDSAKGERELAVLFVEMEELNTRLHDQQNQILMLNDRCDEYENWIHAYAELIGQAWAREVEE